MTLSVLSLLLLLVYVNAFVPISRPTAFRKVESLSLSSIIYIINEDDEDGNFLPTEDDDEEPDEEDVYRKVAASEFTEEQPANKSSLLFLGDEQAALATNQDWGGALGKLRQRVQDVESGASKHPSHALFRLMSGTTPSQQIANFVSTAKPQVVQAMSGAVTSLLGGLATPGSGVDMLVKASGDKIGSLCFQLQMTGYMFRNAEYVLALKDLMNIRATATLQDYKEAFDDLDSDGSGYIDKSEIRELLDDVYDGKTPNFEVEAFVKFFDVDKDGKVSWEEFERGLGSAMAQQNQRNARLGLLSRHDDDDNEIPELSPDVSGTIEVEMEDGTVVEIEAKEYVESLRREATELKAALRKEKFGDERVDFLPGVKSASPIDEFGGIASYLASRQGDLKALTEGVSPEIIETMKKLVEFVLDGGGSGNARADKSIGELRMELPAAALQQLALWQLILGYRLREAEAKGDYLKLLQ